MNTRTKVIVRSPGKNIERGIRIQDRGAVDAARALEQHRRFCAALQKIGYIIAVRLPENDALPDSVFVEDPAVILGNTLVIGRLARQERRGEEVELENGLRPYFPKVLRILPPGLVEGGDVLVTNDHLFIGLSARTNEAGAEQLARLARDLHGYRSTTISLPEDRLHLKGEASFHPSRRIITATERIAEEFRHAPYEILEIPVKTDAERFGANCISYDNNILVDSRAHNAASILAARGFSVLQVDLDEFDKVDGAMTCLCKIF